MIPINLHVYAMPPIDSFWPTLSLKQAGITGTREQKAAILKFANSVMSYFVHCGMGAMREGEHIRVVALPDPDNCAMAIGLLIKEDDNGTTWLALPFDLPYLRAFKNPHRDA